MPDNVRARRPGTCARCRTSLAIGEPIWPRDPDGWLCTGCRDVEQPDSATQLAAKLSYRVRVGRTTPLDYAERATAAEAVSLAAGASHDAQALAQLGSYPGAIDTRTAAALYTILRSLRRDG